MRADQAVGEILGFGRLRAPALADDASESPAPFRRGIAWAKSARSGIPVLADASSGFSAAGVGCPVRLHPPQARRRIGPGPCASAARSSATAASHRRRLRIALRRGGGERGDAGVQRVDPRRQFLHRVRGRRLRRVRCGSSAPERCTGAMPGAARCRFERRRRAHASPPVTRALPAAGCPAVRACGRTLRLVGREAADRPTSSSTAAAVPIAAPSPRQRAAPDQPLNPRPQRRPRHGAARRRKRGAARRRLNGGGGSGTTAAGGADAVRGWLFGQSRPRPMRAVERVGEQREGHGWRACDMRMIRTEACETNRHRRAQGDGDHAGALRREAGLVGEPSKRRRGAGREKQGDAGAGPARAQLQPPPAG